MADFNRNLFKNLLVFLILMGGEEVLTKSPSYILEKYIRYTGVEAREDEYKWGLDSKNKKLLKKYIDAWFEDNGKN